MIDATKHELAAAMVPLLLQGGRGSSGSTSVDWEKKRAWGKESTPGRGVIIPNVIWPLHTLDICTSIPRWGAAGDPGLAMSHYWTMITPVSEGSVATIMMDCLDIWKTMIDLLCPAQVKWGGKDMMTACGMYTLNRGGQSWWIA